MVKVIFRPGGSGILSHEGKSKDHFFLVGIILGIIDVKVGSDRPQPSIRVLARTIKLGDFELEFFGGSSHVGRRNNQWYDWQRERDRWYWIGDVPGGSEKWS
jgi:hypothetical protein